MRTRRPVRPTTDPAEIAAAFVAVGATDRLPVLVSDAVYAEHGAAGGRGAARRRRRRGSALAGKPATLTLAEAGVVTTCTSAPAATSMPR